MAQTPYSEKNASFSNRCHLLARQKIYPHFFKCEIEELIYDDTLIGLGDRANLLDGELAVDRVITVPGKNNFKARTHYVQERFRRPKYSFWQDITITEWNHKSDMPSEFYKLKGGLFVYGYSNDDDNPTDFVEVVICNSLAVIKAIENNTLKFQRKPNPRTGQDFIGISFKDLEKAHLIEFSYPIKQLELFN